MVSLVAERLDQRAQAVILSAARWLALFSTRRVSDLDDQALCVALTGMSCAIRTLMSEAGTGEVATAVDLVAKELLERWHRLPGEPQHQFKENALSRVISAAFLTAPSYTVDAYRRKACEQWALLERCGALADAPRILWSGRRVVALIDRGRELSGVQIGWDSPIVTHVSPYSACVSSIHEVVADLAILSAFGRDAPTLGSNEYDYLRKSLPFWTFYHIKSGDLETVCQLARGLKYARLDAFDELSDAICFILTQAREDGRFGMHDMALYLGLVRSLSAIDVERDISLPVTAASLWALLDCLYPERSPFRPNAQSETGYRDST